MIDQTTQKVIHFVPNMYVCGKISALRRRTKNVMKFGTLKSSENYIKQRAFRFCDFLLVFDNVLYNAGFLPGFAGAFLRCLRRSKHFLHFSHQA